jgi:hypothetical protein
LWSWPRGGSPGRRWEDQNRGGERQPAPDGQCRGRDWVTRINTVRVESMGWTGRVEGRRAAAVSRDGNGWSGWRQLEARGAGNRVSA